MPTDHPAPVPVSPAEYSVKDLLDSARGRLICRCPFEGKPQQNHYAGCLTPSILSHLAALAAAEASAQSSREEIERLKRDALIQCDQSYLNGASWGFKRAEAEAYCLFDTGIQKLEAEIREARAARLQSQTPPTGGKK